MVTESNFGKRESFDYSVTGGQIGREWEGAENCTEVRLEDLLCNSFRLVVQRPEICAKAFPLSLSKTGDLLGLEGLAQALAYGKKSIVWKKSGQIYGIFSDFGH